MASIARDRNGCRRILFIAPDGKRPTIRLGKVSQRTAEGIRYRVEQLLESLQFNRPMEAELAAWVKDLKRPLLQKLARVGLVVDPEAGTESAVTLGEHLANYFAKRADVKQSTLTHWNQTKRLLLAYFGAERAISSITAGDAKDWERWLRTPKAREHRYGEAKADEGLAVNTARKRVSNAKQFFQDAVSRDLLRRNPFAGLKGSVGSNRDRDYFLTREDAAKITEACPDHEWRLIFALSRYGGLRCPSEHLALRWGDIDWKRETMLVRSPKTEHHEGKGSRIVPIFPELRAALDEAWERAEPKAEHVITRYRDANQNLRTTFEKIIHRAGLKPWPKLFHNLRASRATELANEFPAHVAAAWLGHSTIIANKHYWQVTDADIARAIKPVEATAEEASDKAAQKAAHKAAQQVHAGGSKESHAKPPAHKKAPVLLGSALSRETVQNWGIGQAGLEPATKGL